ncbi:MAG: hypothetical protein H0W85_01860 [Methylotenera sp.]|nr:hypothetical protein [Methylotenera sp.]
MAYILRNAQGNIIAASASDNLGVDWQFIEENVSEYIDYLENSLAKNSVFRESDIQLARVLEDLISMLIERNLIRFTDFPVAAQKRLIDRQTMRKKTQLSSILDDDPDSII